MTTIQSTLWISLISIVVLFAACFVIWGLMALLARIPGPKKGPGEEAEEGEEEGTAAAESEAAPEKGSPQKQQAAAVAVAVALALKNRSRAVVAEDGNGTAFSAWKAVARASTVSQRNNVFTQKSRG
jgi:flagellar basal body-associated protein FliL